MGLSIGIWEICQGQHHQKKKKKRLLLQKSPIANIFSPRGRTPPTMLSRWPSWSVEFLCRSPQPLFAVLCLEDSFPSTLLHPLVFMLLLPLCPWCFLSLVWELTRIFHSGLGTPQPLVLSSLTSWVSALTTTQCKKEVHRSRLRVALISGYKDQLLEGSLTAYPFSKTTTEEGSFRRTYDLPSPGFWTDLQ